MRLSPRRTTRSRSLALPLSTALALVVTLAAGCGTATDDSGGDGSTGRDEPGGSGAAAATTPEAITCHGNYRPDADRTAGAQDAELTVEQMTGLPEDGGPRLEFDRMTLEVRYMTSPTETDSVKLFVTDADGEPVTETLYQLGSPGLAEIEFSGGHGFTGLHYIHHEGALLQVWCTADG